MPKDIEIVETENDKNVNWKQFVKPAAFVLVTVAAHVATRLVVNAMVKDKAPEE